MRPSSFLEFEVGDRDGNTWAVNLHEKTCSCREFQLDSFICAHGIAACGHRNLAVEGYISPYYTAEYWRASYAGVHHPHGNIQTWIIPPEVANFVIQPPTHRARAAGRPKKRRIPSQGEEPIRRKCSRCGEVGHNRTTCSSQFPLSEGNG
ncbi:MAG: hypothetical protein EOP45_09050 [Sphingobacteriaceae bacterium]|nr:MAG: hypothetical protein EOP45_09050 [Sphingobacteriaceae bacterium]